MENLQYYLHSSSCDLSATELRFDVLPHIESEFSFSIDKVCFTLTKDLAKRRYAPAGCQKLEKYLRLYRDYAVSCK